jgi:hypothetical protein
VHSDDEFCQDESSTLLGIGKLPYSTQCLVGQTRLLKDTSGLITGELTILKRLSFEQTGILGDLLGSQGWDTDRPTSALGLESSWGRRRADGYRRRRRNTACGLRCDAIESRKRSLLKGNLGCRLTAGLCVSDES